MPDDVPLIVPENHFLTYIPWDSKYLSFIPPQYKKYFLDCLPLLHVRTTDVHVAVCFQYFDRLIQSYETNNRLILDKEVLALSLILHDIGWSQLSEAEIAQSLGVKGLKLNATAIGPKEKHAVEGEKIARQKLVGWGIVQDKINLICLSVRWHDEPDKIRKNGKTPPEAELFADLDHFWSFTHLNFWQDTIRKGVDPKEYAANLGADLDSYFVTQEGKDLAGHLLSDRIAEL